MSDPCNLLKANEIKLRLLRKIWEKLLWKLMFQWCGLSVHSYDMIYSRKLWFSQKVKQWEPWDHHSPHIMYCLQSFRCTCMTVYDLDKVSCRIFKFLRCGVLGRLNKNCSSELCQSLWEWKLFWWLLKLWTTHWCKKIMVANFFADGPSYRLILCPGPLYTEIVQITLERY